MGGRGASLGVSINGKKYGTEYITIHQSGNVKFIKHKGGGSSKAPLETMTKGRIYAIINKKHKIKCISYYDKNNRRYKQIDLTGNPHTINGKRTLPHTHKGYLHSEKGTRNLSPKETKMIDRVSKIWENYKRRQ